MNTVWFVIGIFSVLLLVLATGYYRLYRRLGAVEQEQRRQVEKLRQELAAINSAAIGVGQRLIGLEKKLKTSLEQQDLRGPAEIAAVEPLQQAAYSAESGMTAQELVERYGLCEAEAKLMLLLKAQGGVQEAAGF